MITEIKCSPLQVIPGYISLSFQIKKKKRHAWIVELHFFKNSNKWTLKKEKKIKLLPSEPFLYTAIKQAYSWSIIKQTAQINLGTDSPK